MIQNSYNAAQIRSQHCHVWWNLLVHAAIAFETEFNLWNWHRSMSHKTIFKASSYYWRCCKFRETNHNANVYKNQGWKKESFCTISYVNKYFLLYFLTLSNGDMHVGDEHWSNCGNNIKIGRQHHTLALFDVDKWRMCHQHLKNFTKAFFRNQDLKL